MTIEELKLEAGYDFECNMSEEYKDYIGHDIWGCAFVWLGENQNLGAEYNFCIQGDGTNCSAIYKMELNDETGYMETDGCTFIHYEINFTNSNWLAGLENAMCDAMIKFFELDKVRATKIENQGTEIASLEEKMNQAQTQLDSGRNNGVNDVVSRSVKKEQVSIC